MSSSSSIAKNTLFLFMRMFLTMGVALYTSKVVLNVLGVSDFGVYSVVGGVVAMFGFLNMAMASATQRFLSFEIGTKNKEKLNKIFVIALNIHVAIAVIIFLLAETIGLWFINNKLNIDVSRLDAINWVYQFSIFSLMIRVMQVPFNALIIAREKMNVFAILSIVDVLLKLGVVYLLLLLISDYDKLILYGVLIFVATVLIFFMYGGYCLKKFSETKYTFFYDKILYKELISYSGWSLFGNIAAVARSQGSNVLLNIFFGTVVNAAFGITLQVNSAVKQFVSSFQVAINPQIIKTYAQGNFKQNHNLIFQGSKFSFYLLFIIACPIWLNIDFVLKLWLDTPPNYTSIFIRLAIINLLIDSISGSLMIGAQATGKIKWYQIFVGSLILLDVPITFLVFKNFDKPEYSYFVTITITLLALFLRLYFLKNMINLKVISFLKNVLLKILSLTLISVTLLYFVTKLEVFSDGWMLFLFNSILAVIINIALILLFGFSKSEKEALKNMVLKKIKKS